MKIKLLVDRTIKVKGKIHKKKAGEIVDMEDSIAEKYKVFRIGVEYKKDEKKR